MVDAICIYVKVDTTFNTSYCLRARRRRSQDRGNITKTNPDPINKVIHQKIRME